ncbi:MAG: hypothetical protein WCK88_03285 [bacterium]
MVPHVPFCGAGAEQVIHPQSHKSCVPVVSVRIFESVHAIQVFGCDQRQIGTTVSVGGVVEGIVVDGGFVVHDAHCQLTHNPV